MDRKPPVAMESREPYRIRLKPSERERLETVAREKGLPPSTLGREALLMGLSMIQAQDNLKGHMRVTA